jgi:hypothetical protein
VQQIRALQRHVRLRDVRRQREPRRIRVDFRRARSAKRRLICSAVLAPEVDLPRQRCLQLIDGVRAAAERRGVRAFSGKRSRVLDALPSIRGESAVALASAAASALRVRAAAMFNVGLPRSASSISASSCESFSTFHQSRAGHASTATCASRNVCRAASASASRGDALGASPAVLAQPASHTPTGSARSTIVERRRISSGPSRKAGVALPAK